MKYLGFSKCGKLYVEYRGGESRYSDEEVDYMLAEYEDDDGEEQELYAEAIPDMSDERGTEKELKEEIERQAKEAGIPLNDLYFE